MSPLRGKRDVASFGGALENCDDRSRVTWDTFFPQKPRDLQALLGPLLNNNS